MMHVEAIRKLVEEFNAVEYIRELSTEIMSTNDEYSEDLDDNFNLSLFKVSNKCDVCWIVDMTKDATIEFISQLDAQIENKIIEYDTKKSIDLDDDDEFDYLDEN